jgi:RNA polymerase sigma-70 factor, ECF subfamily
MLVNSSPRDEAALLSRVREGSADALGELYARYGDRVMAVAHHLLGSTPDAEDVLHDVFLGLPEALRRYEESGRFEAWLRQLAARTALTRLRHASRRHEVPLEGASEIPANRTSVDSIPTEGTLSAAIARLPDKLRAVFVLKVIEDHSHATIAAMLGISVGASEVRLVRATRLLRQFIGGAP